MGGVENSERGDLVAAASRRWEIVVVTISQIDFDHEREVAYRRGFVRGLSEALSGIAHKLSVQERARVDGWFDTELMKWAKASEPNCASPPPEFPKTADDV